MSSPSRRSDITRTSNSAMIPPEIKPYDTMFVSAMCRMRERFTRRLSNPVYGVPISSLRESRTSLRTSFSRQLRHVIAANNVRCITLFTLVPANAMTTLCARFLRNTNRVLNHSRHQRCLVHVAAAWIGATDAAACGGCLSQGQLPHYRRFSCAPIICSARR
jgi:hypothetical protein